MGEKIGYPAPGSRTRFQAVLADTRQLIRDLPRVAKALALAPLAANAFPMRKRAGLQAGGARKELAANSHVTGNQIARLPSVTVLVDIGHWDERAKSLGGTSNSLLIGVHHQAL